jgi:hypothetical protein
MLLMWRLCCAMPLSRRESGASHFWSLQTRFKDDRAPKTEPAPFVVVGLPFLAVDNGDGEAKLLPGEDDKHLPDCWPVISAGEARFDTGQPGKV